ncbi:type II toxin-antitoxin system YoeB family toxin [Dethiosulfovibrio peptidovorans]|nr:type II toxin-antitoxin system YoeB family toxin [Dethiosulfovibrio peptidovorans]
MNRFDRIVYRINGGAIEIAQCRSHYGSKDSAINWSPDKNAS